MEKKTYKARPGVDWVNGCAVPHNRKVELTDAEARYDLDMNRIELVEMASAEQKSETAPATVPQGQVKR